MDDLTEKLDYISADDYGTWLTVGMALKHEGYGWETWDEWSRSSPKYQEGVCERKWKSFNELNAGEPATGGTIDHLARLGGWSDDYGEELSLGQLIRDAEPTKNYVFVDKSSERENLPEFDANKYDPRADAVAYLKGMFEADEHIGFNGEFTHRDDRLVPTVNAHGFTAGTVVGMIESGPMKRHGVADLKEQAVREAFGVTGDHGCYVRINPLDGHGDGNSNVTRFDNALIESDEDDIETQYAIYRKLELPIRFLVHSGHHSLHAIVKVDALNIGEYRERVSFLYSFCAKNGLHVDEANKNPSRYSRMPGVRRGDQWQRIVARDIGKRSWDEWREWVEDENDTLPEDESLDDFDELPPLAPELIEGLLREGHKMLVAAPSKAGKSFLLQELAVCVAEGRPWLGRKVAQGKVLYVNLELDPVSCKHRFRDIYGAMRCDPHGGVLVLNLRGRSVPLDKLAPTLIRRYKDSRLKAMIIDPIYKVITGDENAASDMALFCNLFDSIATECGCAMVYSHHYSKGAASKYGNAADRASGSGVFSRDPDAILAMSELRTDEGKVATYRTVRAGAPGVTPTGWRISATLREFPTPPDFDIWFDWPLHVPDEGRILASTTDRGEQGVGRSQTHKADAVGELETQFQMETDVLGDNAVTRDDIMAVTGFSDSKLRHAVTGSDKLMSATLMDPERGKVQVVAVAGAEEIVIGGRHYVPQRTAAGGVKKNAAWLLKGSQTTHET